MLWDTFGAFPSFSGVCLEGDPGEAEDFMRDYGDSRFGRFILYLLAYKNHARD